MKGWFKDSWRHSLARKGVKTSVRRKYSYLSKEDLGTLAEPFMDPKDRHDQGNEHNRMLSNKLKQRVLSRMSKFEEEGSMNHEDNARFMEEVYGPLEKDFHDRILTGDRFKDEVNRAFKLHYQHHKKKNSAFDWDKSEEGVDILSQDEVKKGGLLGW